MRKLLRLFSFSILALGLSDLIKSGLVLANKAEGLSVNGAGISLVTFLFIEPLSLIVISILCFLFSRNINGSFSTLKIEWPVVQRVLLLASIVVAAWATRCISDPIYYIFEQFSRGQFEIFSLTPKSIEYMIDGFYLYLISAIIWLTQRRNTKGEDRT